MSDSAPLSQQQNLSKMQSPGTVGRSAPLASVAPQVQPAAIGQVGTDGSIPNNSSASPVDPLLQPVVSVPLAESVTAADSVVKSASFQKDDSKQTQLPPITSLPTQVSPNTPISAPPSVTPHKESGPVSVIAPSAESAKPVEVIRQSTPEVSVPPEVKEVISVSEEAKPIKVDPQLKKVGVSLVAESTPIAHTPTGDVKLPMTYADALATEKKTKFRTAIHWFAAFVVYQWRKLDPSLKN